MKLRSTVTGVQYLCAAVFALMFAPELLRASPSRPDRENVTSDRGDVPGWVMITMMTAIVVIVLLGVFQEAVVSAVKNAFDSINAQGAP